MGIATNYTEDGNLRRKRRKLSTPPMKENIGEIPILPTEDWAVNQEGMAPVDNGPMDDGDMVDFNYDMNGLTCSEPSYASRC